MYYTAVFGHQKYKYLFKLNVLEFNLNYKISLSWCQYLSHENKMKKFIIGYKVKCVAVSLCHIPVVYMKICFHLLYLFKIHRKKHDTLQSN